MSEDSTPENDSDKSNVVSLFGRNTSITTDPLSVFTGLETPTGGGLSDILDAIVKSESHPPFPLDPGDDGFDMTLSSNKRTYFQGDARPSSLDIEACKVETTLFLMEDMSTSLQLNSLVTRDDDLWDTTVELQKCITKLLTRTKQIQESSEKNDEQ